MRRTFRGVALVAAAALVASTVLAGGITKRGSVTPTRQTIFRIDTPSTNATVFGIVDVAGYVFDLERGVSQVTLMLDNVALHDADINMPREDVRRKYPGFDGEPLNVGFATSFLARNFETGSHTLAIRVRYSNGDEELLGTRTINVDNARYHGPIGALDRPRPTDAGDPYASNDIVSGPFAVTGWALDDVGIRKRLSPTGCTGAPSVDCRWLADIEVLIDGRSIGQSVFYLPRPDVLHAHPDVPEALNSGFQMNLDTTRYSNGPHTIAVRAWDTDPDYIKSAILGTRDVWIDNNYATLKPFGRIDFPMSDANFFSCSCSEIPPVSGIEYNPGNHFDWVAGWVIDQNDNPLYEGIKWVELLFDGVPIKSTWRDCWPVCMAGYTSIYGNCYGLERKDIEYLYPQFLNDAKDSGFFFAVDTDYWIRQGKLHRGLNYLSVRVGTMDPTRPPVIIDQIPVKVRCNEDGDLPSFGELERPEVMQDMTGVELVKGWVVDFNTTDLFVWVDGVLDGKTSKCDGVHLCISRPDVATRYPWLPYTNTTNVGFVYQLDTRKYVDGIHTIVLETQDTFMKRNFFVQRQVRFDNFNR
ncbi:MAG TPA: hypothetical protein PLS53_05080 [Thermoanaerobaculaceae bacterium]|nr:hypothetical protein [Thermoanaerobaculaceae bacterium]HPS77510.1 hypothetical protein [Thermoanaerobaculaceae bacterium]